MRMRTPIRWVLIDHTGGAPCQNGEVMTPQALALIAAAMSLQLARDAGSDSSARAASSPDDVQPGERPYLFVPTLPNAPGAVAYHTVDEQGNPYAMQAITACASLLGPDGALMAASHEAIETEGDPGCNRWASDGQGKLHADERCDAIETQGYEIEVNGVSCTVADFLLDCWYVPGSSAPYTFATSTAVAGAIDPPGPLQTMPADGGNYQAEETDPGDVGQVFAAEEPSPMLDRATVVAKRGPHLTGTPKNPDKVAHWSSRAYRRGVRARKPSGSA